MVNIYLSVMNPERLRRPEDDFEESITGIGAFLREVIKEEEHIELDIDNPDGKVYLGISADVPWNFTDPIKTISKADFHNIINKYIGMLTTEPVKIRWWNIADEADW